MAIYLGDYTTDFGKELKLSWLKVGLVSNVDLQNSRGQFTLTSSKFDNKYLPKVFKENTREKPTGYKIECKTLVIKRFAKLYLSSTEYLKIEIPFLPNSTKFNQIFIDLFYTNLTELVSIGYEGEFMPAYYLRTLR